MNSFCSNPWNISKEKEKKSVEMNLWRDTFDPHTIAPDPYTKSLMVMRFLPKHIREFKGSAVVDFYETTTRKNLSISLYGSARNKNQF